MFAWLPSRPTSVSVHSPLTVSRPNDRETEVGEKGDGCFEVANGDTDVLEFDDHALHATETGRLASTLNFCQRRPRAGRSERRGPRRSGTARRAATRRRCPTPG
jgi:hypothetical protein